MIQTVKEQRDIETNELTGYLVNGSMYVPVEPSNTHYKEVQDWISQGNTPEPAYTDQDRIDYFINKRTNELKQIRQSKVDSIIVTLSTGEVLNGDEVAQTRINRAITGLPDDTTTIDWVDANNMLVKLTKPKLLEALQLSGKEQTIIWVNYNTIKAIIVGATLDNLMNGVIDWTNSTFEVPVNSTIVV